VNRKSCYMLSVCTKCGAVYDVVLPEEVRCFGYAGFKHDGWCLSPLSAYVRKRFKEEKKENIQMGMSLTRVAKPSYSRSAASEKEQ
jgi:hypothetical protein